MPDSARTPRVSLTAQVEQRLKTALITGKMMPGTRLVTKYLAMEMGVSITPVREALLRLAALKALDITPTQTFIVPESNLTRYQEMNRLRKKMEVMALKGSILLLDNHHLRDLRRLHQRVINAITAPQPQLDQALMANMLLRQRLYSIARMPTLLEMIEQLWMRLGPGYFFLWHQPATLMTLYQHYDALLNMLDNRNGTGAEQLIEQIIDQGMSALIARHKKADFRPVLS